MRLAARVFATLLSLFFAGCRAAASAAAYPPTLWPVAFGGMVVLNLAGPLLGVAAMPLLMAFCRPRIEGSQFTTYMALINLCGVTASYLNGRLLKVVTVPSIGLACGLLVLALVAVLHHAAPHPTARVAPAAQAALLPRRGIDLKN